jgi:hypothetical protein
MEGVLIEGVIGGATLAWGEAGVVGTAVMAGDGRGERVVTGLRGVEVVLIDGVIEGTALASGETDAAGAGVMAGDGRGERVVTGLRGVADGETPTADGVGLEIGAAVGRAVCDGAGVDIGAVVIRAVGEGAVDTAAGVGVMAATEATGVELTVTLVGLTNLFEGASGGGVTSAFIFVRARSEAARSVSAVQVFSTVASVKVSFILCGRSIPGTLVMTGADISRTSPRTIGFDVSPVISTWRWRR